MKAFRFPLERVLDWRRMQFEVEQAEIQAIAARIERLDNQSRSLIAERSLAEREVLRAATMESHDLARIAAFQVFVMNERLTIAQTRAQCEHELAAQREKLVEARRRVKLLENLRQRRMAQWTADVARDQEHFAGEAFLSRWQSRDAAPPRSNETTES